MGALSDDGRNDYDSTEVVITPQFIYQAWQDRYSFIGPGLSEECRALVDRLNAMPDRPAAFRFAKAHPWYAESEANKCAVLAF